jgi:hypothetical protein
MNYLMIILVSLLLVTNYYYIDQFNKMNKDVKTIKRLLEDKKTT